MTPGPVCLLSAFSFARGARPPLLPSPARPTGAWSDLPSHSPPTHPLATLPWPSQPRTPHLACHFPPPLSHRPGPPFSSSARSPLAARLQGRRLPPRWVVAADLASSGLAYRPHAWRTSWSLRAVAAASAPARPPCLLRSPQSARRLLSVSGCGCPPVCLPAPRPPPRADRKRKWTARPGRGRRAGRNAWRSRWRPLGLHTVVRAPRGPCGLGTMRGSRPTCCAVCPPARKPHCQPGAASCTRSLRRPHSVCPPGRFTQLFRRHLGLWPCQTGARSSQARSSRVDGCPALHPAA